MTYTDRARPLSPSTFTSFTSPITSETKALSSPAGTKDNFKHDNDSHHNNGHYHNEGKRAPSPHDNPIDPTKLKKARIFIAPKSNSNRTTIPPRVDEAIPPRINTVSSRNRVDLTNSNDSDLPSKKTLIQHKKRIRAIKTKIIKTQRLQISTVKKVGTLRNLQTSKKLSNDCINLYTESIINAIKGINYHKINDTACVKKHFNLAKLKEEKANNNARYLDNYVNNVTSHKARSFTDFTITFLKNQTHSWNMPGNHQSFKTEKEVRSIVTEGLQTFRTKDIHEESKLISLHKALNNSSSKGGIKVTVTKGIHQRDRSGEHTPRCYNSNSKYLNNSNRTHISIKLTSDSSTYHIILGANFNSCGNANPEHFKHTPTAITTKIGNKIYSEELYDDTSHLKEVPNKYYGWDSKLRQPKVSRFTSR